MKRVVTVLLAAVMPLLAFAQEKPASPSAPKVNVIRTHRVTVKEGHDDAFKAAIAAHAQKFHHGDRAVRAGLIISGPGGDVYQLIEGPFSWTSYDERKDLGPEHQKDFDTNVLPHVEKTTPDSFATYEEDLSTVGATDWSEKVITVRYEAKPGKIPLLYDTLKTLKAINEKRGLNVAAWRSFSSGTASITLAYRTKHGWKDLDDDTPSLRKATDALYGPYAFQRIQDQLAEACASITSEMAVYSPELASK